MATEPTGPEAPPPPAAVYQQLATASPLEKTALVLRLVAEHPEGRLVLPGLDGLQAALNEIDLGPGSVPTRGGEAPPGWDAERQAMNLRRADLRGASLRLANLPRVVLEEARLASADLAGANLQGARLTEADCRTAMLEEVNLQGAAARFVNLEGSVLEGANLQGADLWGGRLEGAVLAEANLRDAVLEEADLRGADLQGADLRGAVLRKANLRGANLRGANLQGAVLAGANLEGVVLCNARLEEVDLSTCIITHIHTSGIWFAKTRFDCGQLGGAIGEELAGQFEEARKGYLALERNFEELGDPDAASWAYRKKRRMQKRDNLRSAREALRQRRWRAAAGYFLNYAADQFVEWICAYGESVPRVLASLLVVYVLFILLYGLTGSVVRLEAGPGGTARVPTARLVDLAIFSLTAMTTSGTPAVGLLPSNEFVHLLTGLQAFLGIALTGLLGFVAGNRIRR